MTKSVANISLLLILLLWLGPRLPALHHQEQGARLLARALLAEGRGEEGSLWLEPQPLTRPEAQTLAAQALARFDAAIAADPGNFQAHRWLGRAALLLDRPEEAVAAFSAAAHLRPANPLAWWDLGLAYERLAPPPDLPIPGAANRPALAQNSKPAIINATGPIPTLIPAVAAEAPPMSAPDSDPSATGYSLPATGYTSWLLPDAPDAWPGWWVPPDPVRRTVLLFLPPGQISFRISLPVTPTALLFWMGMDPLLPASQGDGVVYRVQVEGAEVFSYTLRPEAARGGWWPARVDLTPWAGQTVSLTLSLDPGPAGDAEGDWAGWGDLQLVPADSARCRLASCHERAAAAWRKGGFTAQDLVQAGEAARKAKRYEEALRWYGRAVRLEPGLADPWYYAGLAYEGMERWEEALAAYGQAVGQRSVGSVIRQGSIYYRIGRILQWHIIPRPIDDIIAAYGQALAIGDFDFVEEEADLHYSLGVVYWWQRPAANPEWYIGEFEVALELNPNHAWASLLLGRAYFLDFKDLDRAKTYILRSINLKPDNPWGYLYLGDVLLAEGLKEQARAQYQKALQLAPGLPEAEVRMQALEE